MKVLLCADIRSVHTQRWLKALSENKIETGCFSLNSPLNKDLNIKYYEIKQKIFCNKAGYLLALPYLKEALKDFKPDILHAHYASGYGTLAALSAFHPFILSVWGSDIFSFPHKSILHRLLLTYNLKSADKILATSKVMANETKKYIDKEVYITPFGIDTSKFKPTKKKGLFGKKWPIIGCFKRLDRIYGQDYLIEAFNFFKNQGFQNSLLILAGEGPDRIFFEKKIKSLQLEKNVIFTGDIKPSNLPEVHNECDLEVYLSRHESFGVAVLEAGACGKPVIVSDVEGLPEIVVNEKTGFIVPKNDWLSAAKAMLKIISLPKLYNYMSKNARKRVIKEYEWNISIKKMLEIYRTTINSDV